MTNESKKPRFRIESNVFVLLIQPLFKEHFESFNTWEILKMKRAFEDYLVSFDNEKLLDIPKKPVHVIMNISHPLKTNGFNPETVLHFIQFSKTYEVKC